MARYDQCDATCTTDCGHCKGAGPPRFRVTVVSVGDAGLAQRPAVLDTQTGDLATVDGEPAKVWRSSEEHLAQAAADRLNKES